jgi:hypothetical protein
VKPIPALPFINKLIEKENIKKQIEQKNKEDEIIVKKDLEHMVEKSFPYLAGKVQDIQLLKELDYIRVMYQRPLPTERKIILRQRVLLIIDSGKVSNDIYYGMIQLLQDYHCL